MSGTATLGLQGTEGALAGADTSWIWTAPVSLTGWAAFDHDTRSYS